MDRADNEITFKRTRLLKAARAAAAAVAVVALAASGAAHASRTSAAAFEGSATLKAVSCHGTSWCMAVGSYTTRARVTRSLAQIWNGRSWRVLKGTPGTGLTTVSCPNRSFCMVTGGRPTQTASWNGSTWTAMPSPRHAGSPPSCGGPKVCMVINLASIHSSGAMVEAWFGRIWRSYPKQTGVCVIDRTGCGLLDVSCGDTTNCVAVGYTMVAPGQFRPEAALWDGTNWRLTVPPGASNGAQTGYYAVSCAGTFCMAFGDGLFVNANPRVAITYDATTTSWKVVYSTGNFLPECAGCFGPGSLSCASSVNCMELASFGNLAWNGTKVEPAPSVSAGRGSDLGAVSCAANYCVAVGHRTIKGVVRTLAELWNGTRWKILATPNLT